MKLQQQLPLFSKKNWLLFSILFLFYNHLFAQIPQRKCLEKANFYDVIKHIKLEEYTNEWIKNRDKRSFSRGVIVIPVVVHIVYQTETENLSNEQIQSQIVALNRDFNLQNDNLDKVAIEFKDRIANIGFDFCLAVIDPNGNPTNGITRTPTDEEKIYGINNQWIYHTERGGHDAWDAEKYLNIWVTKTNGLLGFGAKPGENEPAEDGVVVAAKYFGIQGSAILPFHLGRTATHEVGHYFNLWHPWGGGCEGDDFVSDTPLQSDAYAGCPDPNSTSCESKDITANYMNFSEDECLAMFTKGQSFRMRAALIGARKGLLVSTSCDEIIAPNPMEKIRIYPNPASYYFCIETNLEGTELIPFQMLDTKGAVIQKGAVMPHAIQHFATTQNGIYFLQFFVNEEDPIVKKIVLTP